MSPYEITNIIISTGHRIDAQWALFLTIHMALFGGIIYVDRPLNRTEKAFAIIFYSVFAVLNFIVSLQQQIFYEHAANDILVYAAMDCCRESEIISYFKMLQDTGKFELRPAITLFVHIIAGAIVICSIFFDGAFKKPSVPRRLPRDSGKALNS